MNSSMATLAADTAALPLPEWLLRLLSVDPATLDGTSGQIRFARFPEGGWALLTLLAVCLALGAVVWLYRREASVRRTRQLLMAAIRGLVVIALATVLFYPVLEIDRVRPVEATTILLLDESMSQGIKDRYLSSGALKDAISAALEIDRDEVASRSRAELVELALTRPAWRILPRLSEKNRLKVYGFSRLPLRPLTWQPAPPSSSAASGAEADASERSTGGRAAVPGEIVIGVEPRGEATDLAAAIRSAVELEAGGRVAGIVVITDGRSNVGEDLKGVGAFLREQGIAVHAVGVGDPAPTRNLRVAAVLAGERVFVGDPVVADVRVEHKGFAGESVRVELLDEYPSGGGAAQPDVVVAWREVKLSDARSEETVSFRFQPTGLGAHRLLARISLHPEESFSEDNGRATSVEVVEEASRVLLVAGGPSYEYRYLKNLLKRDTRVTLSSWLASADADYPQEGNIPIQKLPSTRKELFVYDVVILMDVDPGAAQRDLTSLLEEFVSKHRGGLCFVAGDKHSLGVFESAAAAPMRDLLPVVVDLADVQGELEQGKFYEREWALLPTPEASRHAATRLSSDIDRNQVRWAEIASFYWSFPVRRPKPGATVLFVHPDPILQPGGQPRPLVVTQYYGGGRVMWCGIDSTWRWRALAEEVYDRFWIQSTRFLTEGRLRRDRRAQLQTDSEEYDLGETMRITAHILDENYEPVEGEEYAVHVEAPDGTTTVRKLRRDVGAPGWFRGIYTPPRLGTYSLRTADGGLTQVRVEPPRFEFHEPQLDEQVLRELAELTRGTYARLPEIQRIPALIPDRRQTIVTTDEPIPLWDNWLSIGLLAGLLTVEWILRKANRLL